ncbi:MAG: hypothetical protein SGPRY_003342, partial [Prymnesium sp.]
LLLLLCSLAAARGKAARALPPRRRREADPIEPPSPLLPVNRISANFSIEENRTFSRRLVEWVCRHNPALYLPVASALLGEGDVRSHQLRSDLLAAKGELEAAERAKLVAEERVEEARMRVLYLERSVHTELLESGGTVERQAGEGGGEASRGEARGGRRRSGKETEGHVLAPPFDEKAHIAIVTTAAPPWMTGTAVNPLLRAAHLAKAGRRVTLMIPWLHPHEQPSVFPAGLVFASPSEQEQYIRGWLAKRAGIKQEICIRFYPGRYDKERGSILPLGDITTFFHRDESDICVLEEPEHLTWYHNGLNWRHRSVHMLAYMGMIFPS